MGRVLFWVKCIGVLDGFVVDRGESSMELAMPIQSKLGIPS